MNGDYIFIKNARIFTGKEVIEGNLLLDGATVTDLGSGFCVPEGAKLIDARGRLVTPGFTIAHTHIYSALARGIGIRGEPPHNFLEILEKLWWNLDSKLSLEQIELCARVYAIECLKSGVTTIFDHHASYGTIKGSLKTIARAVKQTGVRACLCFEVSDRLGNESAEAAIEENMEFLEELKKGDDAISLQWLNGMFGLHASFTLNQDTLKKCALAVSSDDIGFHIHVAEDRKDQEITHSRYGKRVVERLMETGILGRKTICSHCIWLEPSEIKLISKSGSTVAYNPQSNMNNGVGVLKLKDMVDAGIIVVLGTDGFTANVLREALAGHILQSYVEGDPSAGWKYFPSILLQNNNILLEKFFGFSNSEIAKGGKCDIVLWDYDPPTPIEGNNFWGHAIFGLLDARASFVIVNGMVVLENGLSARLDEGELKRESRNAALSIWKKMS